MPRPQCRTPAPCLTNSIRRHPQITVEIRNLNFVDHMTRLINGEVDVVFLRPPVPSGIQSLPMAGETRVVCLPAHDPLAARASVMLSELADRPVVDVPPEVPRLWWDFWVTDPRPDGSPVRYGPVAADLEALLHTVAAGTAIAFLPAAARTFFPARASRTSTWTAWHRAPPPWPGRPRARTRPAIAAIRQAAATVLAAKP